eukprot:scaffold33332_cov31-Tisochrysis_lutea.AAC.3
MCTSCTNKKPDKLTATCTAWARVLVSLLTTHLYLSTARFPSPGSSKRGITGLSGSCARCHGVARAHAWLRATLGARGGVRGGGGVKSCLYDAPCATLSQLSPTTLPQNVAQPTTKSKPPSNI